MLESFHPMFLYLRNILDRITVKEIALRGGWSTTGVVRVGDTVRRPVSERSPFVHDLLRFLECRKFDCAPRFLGIDEKGREILTYIPGNVPHRINRFRKEQWVAGAKLLRQLHDITVDCELKGKCEVICHGDPSPENYVFRDGIPCGFIDFDVAHPGKRQEDVGYAAWRWLCIGDPKLVPEEQGERLADFMTAYDAAATWNPLELVLQAQHSLLVHLPKRGKWGVIKMWALGCIKWTKRNRERIAVGMAMHSTNAPSE